MGRPQRCRVSVDSARNHTRFCFISLSLTLRYVLFVSLSLSLFLCFSLRSNPLPGVDDGGGGGDGGGGRSLLHVRQRARTQSRFALRGSATGRLSAPCDRSSFVKEKNPRTLNFTPPYSDRQKTAYITRVFIEVCTYTSRHRQRSYPIYIILVFITIRK